MALKSKKGGRARGIAKVTLQSRVHRKVGVYWGRFNPPHKVHMRVIRRLKEQCDLVVAVGSSEHNNKLTNAFSGAERKLMVGYLTGDSNIFSTMFKHTSKVF